jgi:uncharacterized protein (TIGR03084 family)
MVDMERVCTDLQEEYGALDTLLSGLDEADWNRSTPAEGWMVRDQISHIGSTDRVATIAAGEPERFKAEVLSQDRQDRMARQLQEGRAMSGAELLAWWRTGSMAMLEIFRGLDPKHRIPWFGPAMSAVSFATARLMETWAHGQDIVDALGVPRQPTERLRHIAHIGVLARPFSYRQHDQEPPTEDVRVELVSPADALWTWGDAQASNRVNGEALDFCMVVTQRRHLADTDLQIAGPVAEAWMRIAQAFAGPPGSGRNPGQFPKQH